MDTGLNWVQALPLVLIYVHGRANPQTGLSPLEVLSGLPMRMAAALPYRNGKLENTLQQVDDQLMKYMSDLCNMVKSVHSQVKEALSHPQEGQLHSL